MINIEENLKNVIEKYSKNFTKKVYFDSFNTTDVLMEAFGITQELKSENKQYWGRELGKCWESLLQNLFRDTCTEYQAPKRFGKEEPADFFIGKDAIDTKYRVGSGDSGTLKKFEAYGKLLQSEGYRPIFLFLRTDNLQSALSKMDAGGWIKLMGDDAFNYILEKTHFDLKAWLIKLKDEKKYLLIR